MSLPQFLLLLFLSLVKLFLFPSLGNVISCRLSEINKDYRRPFLLAPTGALIVTVVYYIFSRNFTLIYFLCQNTYLLWSQLCSLGEWPSKFCFLIPVKSVLLPGLLLLNSFSSLGKLKLWPSMQWNAFCKISGNVTHKIAQICDKIENIFDAICRQPLTQVENNSLGSEQSWICDIRCFLCRQRMALCAYLIFVADARNFCYVEKF